LSVLSRLPLERGRLGDLKKEEKKAFSKRITISLLLSGFANVDHHASFPISVSTNAIKCG
jgi:hypothetical protein